MKAYKDVISLIKETKTLSSQITKLGKVRAITEDDKLISLLNTVIRDLQVAHSNSRSKSTPVCLNQSQGDGIKFLANYCQQVIGSQKPEWVVIAERNGWAPKI